MGKFGDFLSRIWPWFQTTADKIEEWDLSPQQKELVNQIWLTLPIKIQETLWALLKKLADMYGDDFAKKILTDVLEALKKVSK